MVDVCCLQEVRWRRHGACMLWVEGRRFMLWWYAIGDGVGGVKMMRCVIKWWKEDGSVIE